MKLRIRAHNAIDNYWHTKALNRGQVYSKLERMFGRPIHIGESDEKLCEEIIKKAPLLLNY